MSSTKIEMVKMLREGRQIPNSIQEKDLGRLAAIERNLAQMRLTLKQNVFLSSTVGNIEAGLNQLGNLKSQLSIQGELITQFAPLKSETKERIIQRDKLVQDLDAHLDNMKEVIPQIKEAFEQNNPQKAEIGLKALEKTERTMTKDFSQLKTNEENLQKKLDTLHIRTFQSIPNEERSKLATPSTLAEQQDVKRLD